MRQAALLAKIPSTVECFGVAMGCASGMKAITVAAQAIAMGQAPLAVGGHEVLGRESKMFLCLNNLGCFFPTDSGKVLVNHHWILQKTCIFV